MQKRRVILRSLLRVAAPYLAQRSIHMCLSLYTFVSLYMYLYTCVSLYMCPGIHIIHVYIYIYTVHYHRCPCTLNPTHTHTHTHTHLLWAAVKNIYDIFDLFTCVHDNIFHISLELFFEKQACAYAVAMLFSLFCIFLQQNFVFEMLFCEHPRIYIWCGNFFPYSLCDLGSFAKEPCICRTFMHNSSTFVGFFRKRDLCLQGCVWKGNLYL